MKITEALDAVNRNYVPGVAKYYAGLSPDPWMQAHEELEAVMQRQNWAMTEPALERFVSRCHELIDRFKREGVPSGGVSMADAANIADVNRVRHWQSRKGKHCVQCEGKENLGLLPIGPEGLEVVIICAECRSKARSA